jgi:hypothetical protein
VEVETPRRASNSQRLTQKLAGWTRTLPTSATLFGFVIHGNLITAEHECGWDEFLAGFSLCVLKLIEVFFSARAYNGEPHQHTCIIVHTIHRRPRYTRHTRAFCAQTVQIELSSEVSMCRVAAPDPQATTGNPNAADADPETGCRQKVRVCK